MGSLVDAVAGFFGGQHEKHAGENIINTFDHAGQNAVAGYGAARDASLGYFQPYLEGGTNAFARAGAMTQPGYEFGPSDPSYKFRFDQGLDAATRGAASTGALGSGGTLKALTRYGQGMASTEYGNAFSRLNQLAGMGIDAARGSSAAQLSAAGGSANALLNAAQGMTGGFQTKAGGVNDSNGAVAGGIKGIGSFFGIPGF
jgi:hypothetical protein